MLLSPQAQQLSAMSSRKTAGRRGPGKKRAQRATSNVFAMFDQAQIAEFKEAFNMIDQNRDGFVEKEDLHDMLASLGKNPTEEYLDQMMNEAPGPINFTMFLTLFGERLQGTDPEDVIKNAFGCFDEDNLGQIPEDRLRELLTTMGDRFTDEDVNTFASIYLFRIYFEYNFFLLFARSMRCIARHPSRAVSSTTWSSLAS